MKSDENKRLVRQFYDHLNNGNVDEAFALASDDSTWWLSGSLPISGTNGKDFQVAAAKQSSAGFKGGLQLEIVTLMAEGDTVALELEAHAEMTNGQVYDQVYVQFFTVRDGKIIAMRNYIDTDKARRAMEAASAPEALGIG